MFEEITIAAMIPNLYSVYVSKHHSLPHLYVHSLRSFHLVLPYKGFHTQVLCLHYF